MNGCVNGMDGGAGRTFMFGCRTNGTLVWDQLRAIYGMEKEEYSPAEAALQQVPIAQGLVFWQPRNESFPPSGSFALVRVRKATPNLGTDYAGLIETTLAAVYHHSAGFARETTKPLYVTGGARNSPGIMRRVSAIWQRPIIPVEKGGAALGAAAAGVSAFFKSEEEEVDIEQFCANLLSRGETIQLRPDDVSAIHGPGGYLNKFAAEEAKLIATHPLN